MIRFVLFSFFLFESLFFSVFVYAEETSKTPIEISAKSALEWRRNDHQYVARGAVVAKQEQTEIQADEMTADYRDAADDQPVIYRLTARGNVRILSSDGRTVTGDIAVYDVDQKKALVTGKNLEMTAPDQIVTAQEKFEYWSGEDRIVATGAAYVQQGSDSITADVITAWMEKDQAGNRVMARAVAEGHVVITTPAEQAKGTRAVYERATDIATLEGPVTITREKNVLTGFRAEVNLKTGRSTLYGNKADGGRVKGVFYTNSVEAR